MMREENRQRRGGGREGTGEGSCRLENANTRGPDAKPVEKGLDTHHGFIQGKEEVDMIEWER